MVDLPYPPPGYTDADEASDGLKKALGAHKDKSEAYFEELEEWERRQADPFYGIDEVA